MNLDCDVVAVNHDAGVLAWRLSLLQQRTTSAQRHGQCWRVRLEAWPNLLQSTFTYSCLIPVSVPAVEEEAEPQDRALPAPATLVRGELHAYQLCTCGVRDS